MSCDDAVTEDDLTAWLRLLAVVGLGAAVQRKLLRHYGSPGAVLAAPAGELAVHVGERFAAALRRAGEGAFDAHVATALAWQREVGHRIITLADADYPPALLELADPPLLLYAKGRLELLGRSALAIVGARNATPQGVATATGFARTLAEAGLCIVSGLALGIDAAAHRGGLAGQGSTIAVVGTGADRIYPGRNETLAREIARRGLLLSEFPLGTPPFAENFPRRNRLIAALARGCLVVEAAERSGSLITACLAGELGRDVFAVPGSIHSPLSRGSHRLIREGAKLVETAADVLEELRWAQLPGVATVRRVGSVAASDPDAVGLLAALGYDPCDLDTLVARSGLGAERVLAQLMALELAGRIDVLPGGRYQRR